MDVTTEQQENVFQVININGEVKWVKTKSTLLIDRVADTDGSIKQELKYICMVDPVDSVWTKFKEEESKKERENYRESELEGIAEAIPHLVWATEVRYRENLIITIIPEYLQ